MSGIQERNTHLFQVKLRRLTYKDKELLFEWRNLPEIVRLSSSQKKVLHSEHSRWFDKMLTSDRTVIFIFEDLELPIGQVRFDLDKLSGCLISIYLVPKQIGKGRGAILISMSVRKIIQVWKHIKWIDAYIRPENIRSVKAFERAGFRRKNLPDSSDALGLIMMRLKLAN